MPSCFPVGKLGGMANGGRRKCVKLLTAGISDPCELMRKLDVGPGRLAVILKSPLVRRWRNQVDLVKAELEAHASTFGGGDRGEAPDQVRQSLAGILQGVCDGRYEGGVVEGVLAWVVRILEVRARLLGIPAAEREAWKRDNPEFLRVQDVAPGLLPGWGT